MNSEGGVYIGELLTPLSTQPYTTNYRYLVYDGVNHSKNNWEYIHRAKYRTTAFRSVSIGGKHAV